MKYLALLLTFSAVLWAQIILNEIMFNTAGNEYHDEFIEIYNNSDTAVDLNGWAIGDQDEADLLIRYNGLADMILQPYSYCVVMDSSYYLNSVYYEDVIPDSVLRVMINDGSFGASGLSNSIGETVNLFSADSVLSDSYTYTIDQDEGYSDERISFDTDSWANSNYSGGTPGFKNSVVTPDHDLLLKELILPDVIQSPGNPTVFEVKVINRGLISAVEFSVNAYIDDVFQLSETFTGTLLPNDSVLVDIELNFERSGTTSLMFEIEFDPDENLTNNSVSETVFVPYSSPPLVLNEFMSVPSASQCEYIEIFVASDTPVRLGDFGISDEDKSRVKFFPDSLAQPGSYIVMAKNDSIFNFDEVIAENVFIESGLATLNNADDTIYLLTSAGTAIDSIAYSGFDQAGTSVEKIAPELDSDVLNNWTLCLHAGTPTRKNSVMPLDNDLKLTISSVPARIDHSDFNTFGLTVHNAGYNTLTGFQISVYIENAFYSSAEHSYALSPCDSVNIETDIFFDISGTVEVRFELEADTDDDPGNNTATVQIFVPYETPPLALNEFMKNPSGDQCEYIEIVNTSDSAVELGDFGLSDENKSNAVFFPDSLYQPGDFIVMAKDSLIFNFSNVLNSNVFTAPGLASLNNSSDKIFLLSKDGLAIDSISYSGLDDDSGRSIEKINPALPSHDLNSWVYCVGDGTPTDKNSVFQEPEDIGSGANFRISPKTATPNGDGNDDNLMISYEFDSAYVYLTMKIYNIKGQLIATPLNGDYSSSKGSYVWNCTASGGRTVDTGAYICLLKAKDDSGKVTDLKEAFYIAK
ncbi:MAG: lamin tail domain-containing protein [Candidatus Delongbacteria bacterium]|nr:lamin tail domain-containing protein [Candidatus Delongbacteria bacterium]